MNNGVVVEPPLYFADEGIDIWCAEFHPCQDIMATTLINGNIEMYLSAHPDYSTIPMTSSA